MVSELTSVFYYTPGANSRFFDNNEQIPTTALTMGNSSTLAARKVILLAFERHKRFALEKLLAVKVTTEYQVTALIDHDDVTVITDIAIIVCGKSFGEWKSSLNGFLCDVI